MHQLKIELREKEDIPDFLREHATISGMKWSIHRSTDYDTPLPEGTRTVFGGIRGIDVENYPHHEGTPLLYVGTVFHPVGSKIKELKLFTVEGLDFDSFPEDGGCAIVSDDFTTPNIEMQPVSGVDILDLVYAETTVEFSTSGAIPATYYGNPFDFPEEWISVSHIPEILGPEAFEIPENYSGPTREEFLCDNPESMKLVRSASSPYRDDSYTEEERLENERNNERDGGKLYLHHDDTEIYGFFSVMGNPENTEYRMQWMC